MKKLILIASIITSLALPYFLNSPVLAATSAVPNCGSGSANGTPEVCTELSNKGSTNDPVLTIIKAAIDVVSFLAGALAVVFIVAAGLRYVMSGGDSSAMATARSNLIYAAAGIVVVGMAQAIVIFVLNKVK